MNAPPSEARRGPRATLRASLAPDRARFAAGAIVAATVVALVAMAAGVARILPSLLDPGVPWRAARPFVMGLLALALEIGALVGWPLGWVEIAVRSQERGEARARMALGESPAKRLLRLWPTIALLASLGALGSLAWGRDARGPGRIARALVAEGRATCLASSEPRAVAVPLVRATWLCRPGLPPILLGRGAGNASAITFAAESLDISDDLTTFTANEAQILVPASDGVRFAVHEARVTGLHPFSAPSSVPPWARALSIVTAALLSALVATGAALAGVVRARVAAWGLALVGPAVTLVVLRALEQAQIGDGRLVLVPLAALTAASFARFVAYVLGRVSWRRRAGASVE